MLVMAQAACPNCGAPLRVDRGQTHVICVFCNTSLHVSVPVALESSAQAPPVQLTPEQVSKEDIERIKSLVIEGRRDEAIATYERAARVSPAEAEKAVNEMMLPSLGAYVRRLPINAFGFVLYGTLIGAGALLATWGVTMALDDSPAYFALVVLGGAFALWQLVSFFRKLVSTLVVAFGKRGTARVLNRVVLTTEHRAGAGAMIVVVYEVTPADGGTPFVDQEPLLVHESSIAKLEPGNVIPVKYDSGRTRVFPISPIQVLATGRGGYR